MPEIRTPRDLLRLVNAFSVTWPAVRGEVNVADFVALETLRLFQPKLYNAIRANKSRLTSTGASMDEEDKYDRIFLTIVEKADQSRQQNTLIRATLKDALNTLFPRLEDRMHYNVFHEEFAKQRRVCSETNFDTYFRFSISGQTISREAVQELINQADQDDFIRKTFLTALEVTHDGGRTRASYLLDELIFHADEMPSDRVKAFLSTLLSISDDLEIDADNARLIGGNSDRIYRLVKKILFSRFELPERSEILKSALERASLECLIDISYLASRDHYSREGRNPEPPDMCLMEKADVDIVRKQALDHIRKAAEDNRLMNVLKLPFVLRQWRNMADSGSTEVRAWSKRAIESDDLLPDLAKGFFSDKGIDRNTGQFEDRALVDEEDIEELLDTHRFRERLEEAVTNSSIPSESREIMQRILDAWEAQEAGRN